MYLQVCKTWIHIKKNGIRGDWGRMQPPPQK